MKQILIIMLLSLISSAAHATPEEDTQMILNFIETQQVINDCLQLSMDNADPHAVLDCTQGATDSLHDSMEYLQELEQLELF